MEEADNSNQNIINTDSNQGLGLVSTESNPKN